MTMIAKYLSEMWTSVAPALGNHLWQSTLFAVVAGLLTLVLRKNHARARYWMWLAASVKFLIPFSVLVGLGSYLGWSHTPATATSGLYFAMEEMSQPFTQSATPTISQAAATPDSQFLSSLTHLLPVILAAAWLCGFLAVVIAWCVRWRRMSGSMRGAVPLREGREVWTLRRVERSAGVRKRIDMFLSRASLEPGIFGIARPVLVWPEGISERLEDAHVEAILAHEVWHVRRRDNLAAAIHMFVEAIFWFHPLVWWLGARLVEERECACDEEVLELGSNRQTYAESILKICEFCVCSPLACVSGVTGADLKKRILRIMTEGTARKMDFSRKCLLSTAVLIALAAPVVAGLMNSQQDRGAGAVPAYRFEVSTIKPNNTGISRGFVPGFTTDGYRFDYVRLRTLVMLAYGVRGFQILGAPAWLDTETYNVEAKMDGPTAEALSKLRPDQLKLARRKMLQSLLEERFGLKVHRETKEGPIYSMVVAKGGLKLRESKPVDSDDLRNADGTPMQGTAQLTRSGFVVRSYSAPKIAILLSQEAKRPVVDKTGLTGIYDFTLEWDRQLAVTAPPNGDEGDDAPDVGGISFFSAIQKQLGLRLVPDKGPVETIVIDHVERPSGN